jgi:hypothetical protein
MNKKLALGLITIGLTISMSSQAGFKGVDWKKGQQIVKGMIKEEIMKNEVVMGAYDRMSSDIDRELEREEHKAEESVSMNASDAELERAMYNSELAKDMTPPDGACELISTYVEIAKNECIENVVMDTALLTDKTKTTGNGMLVFGTTIVDENGSPQEISDQDFVNNINEAFHSEKESFTKEEIDAIKNSPGKFFGIENHYSIKTQLDILEKIIDDKVDYANIYGEIDDSISDPALVKKNDTYGITVLGLSNLTERNKTMTLAEISTSQDAINFVIPTPMPSLSEEVGGGSSIKKVAFLKNVIYTETAKSGLLSLMAERVSVDPYNVKSPSHSLDSIVDKKFGSHGGAESLSNLINEANDDTVQATHKLVADMMRLKVLSDYKALRNSVRRQYILTIKLAKDLNNY